MSSKGIFDRTGDGSEDDGTFYSLSGEFLEAARVLQITPKDRVNFSLVTYYLLGHAVELMLKAFLFKHKIPTSELRNIGHNLEGLISSAHEHGLPKALQLPLVRQLARTYKGKDLEYRRKKKREFPALESLMEEIKNLQSAIFDHVQLS